MKASTNSELSAYPSLAGSDLTTCGVTKREFLAAMAMQGMCASGEYAAATAEQIARYSLQCADALLNALNPST